MIGLASTAFAQAVDNGDADGSSTRIFGIIPNYRTSPTLANYTPLDALAKTRVAAEDAFDRSTFALAVLFATQAHWTEAAPSFGHGVPAFGRYYSAALTELIVGDFMTEVIYPIALRQDPRYFRRGTGSVWGRLGYAVGQMFLTHTDRGTGAINVSELGGNATAVAIGNLYYRRRSGAFEKCLAIGLADRYRRGANILKEFWPDRSRTFGHRHAD